MYSITGTTLVGVTKNTAGLWILIQAPTTGMTLDTTASTYAPGCLCINIESGIHYKNNGTAASPSWQDVDNIGTSEIADAAVTPVKYNIVEARTVTVAGATTGTISATTTHVTVTSDDVNKILILPAPVVGREIVIHAGTTGFELRSSDPSTIAINSGTGSNVESAIVANSTCYLVCVTATAWKGFFMDADGDVAKIEIAA